MKALWTQRKVIVSEKDQTGAAIYHLGSADSGMKPRICEINLIFCKVILIKK
jgi:hypothetical protein